MSAEARKYVKLLQFTPRACGCPVGQDQKPRHGSRRVTVQEHAVLWCLADHHNPNEGCCWPSVRTVAAQSGLSDRRVREIHAALECRGVIQRRSRMRSDGSQTSNAYFFPALGLGALLPGSQQDLPNPKGDLAPGRSTGREKQWTGPAGVRVAAGPASRDMNREMNSIEEVSGTCPHEAGGKLPPTPLKGGSVNTSLFTNSWAQVCCVLKSDLASTACSTHLSDDYDRCFRDTWQVGVIGERLVIMAEKPDTLKAGLAKYEKRIKHILNRLFGSAVTGVDVMTDDAGLEGETTHG